LPPMELLCWQPKKLLMTFIRKNYLFCFFDSSPFSPARTLQRQI
jgi:hypothetical protein